MSTIQRMQILGIRSFDHRSRGETINFEGPLTLIVGFNGSGKTTVVECLKYVTTGQLPPNSKGGAFIHDPKLTGDKEVKAQVKLGFRNASGHQMVITRSLELTVKKTAVTQRAVDSSLLLKHHGERVAISTKVAELDKIVPEYLGVSPAILDNVIFCHQDDSLWPMSEPMKLKLKFDQIFEAQKYTSAIESITKLRKSHNTNLGQLVIHEKHAKELKDIAERKQKKMTRLEADIEELRVKIANLDQQLVATKALSAEKQTKLNDALGIVNELKMKIEQARGFEYTLQSLKDDRFVELEESDEWLQSTLDQYEERMNQYAQQSEKYKTQYQELQGNAATTRRQTEQKQSERGQYQAEKKSYETHIQTRLQLVKEAARSHSLRGYDGDLDEYQVQEFVGRVQKLSQEKDRELDRIRKETNDDLRETRDVLSKLENRQASRTQEKVTARQAITTNERKIKLRQDEIALIKTDEGARAALEVSLHGIREQLQKAQSDFAAASWDQTLKTEKKNLQDLELEAKSLRDELVQSTNLASDLAALNFAKAEAKKAQHSLEAMVSTHNVRLTSIIGPGWQPESLEREFQDLLDRKDRALSEAKKQQEGADREYRDQEYKLQTAKSSLKKKNEEMQKCESAVLVSILTSEGNPLSSVSQYLEELNLLEKSQIDLQKELDGMTFVRDYYTKSLEIVAQQNCCRLCVRPFSGKEEKIAASNKLHELIGRLVKEETEEELREVEQDLRSAKAVRAQADTYQRLSGIEIPSLEKDIKQLETEKQRLVKICGNRDKDFNNELTAKREVESLTPIVGDIVKYLTEIDKHQETSSRLSSQQKFSSSSMTVNEIQEKSASCDEQIQIAKNRIDKLSTDRQQAISKVADLEKESVNLSHKLSETQHQLDKKRDIQTAIDELHSDTNQQLQAISRADLDLESMIPEFTKAKTQDEDARRRGEAKLKHVQAEKDTLAQTVNKFNMVEAAITDYIENGGPGKLTTCERAIKNLEKDQERIDDEISEITKNANQLKSRMDNSEKTQRSILDNIRYRKSVHDLNVVRREISELEGRNAEEEAEHYKREQVSADREYQNLLAERGPTVGTMNAKDVELADLIQEWNDEYQNAAEEYREMHIKVETTKAAIEDMGKCSLALENAIMRYHTLKMEEINAIAAELWRTTYQGSDVDTIMIKSENETASINAQKRNYNYRMVMVKSDTEMDMRGRCSAGQKVLASIIIRLALAECFGANCGVIALDEPTTNLDRDNIIALAKSLHAIIKARKHQSNFQLIIITHDEEFLKHMQCNDFCDNYWRVSRNAEQKSIIERQKLTDFV